jgi:peptide/nickel transport system substrate-binding protein
MKGGSLLLKPIFAAASAAALLTSILTGCSKSAPGPGSAAGGSAHPWTQPGVLRFAEFLEPKTLVSELGSSSATADVDAFVFSYAVKYDDHARPVPDALSEIPTVENGDVSKDGLTLKYKLRHNITWHDGAPLTCKDLRFTWQVIMNPHNNVNTTDGFNDIKDIDCSDPYVAVIHMKRLYAPYLQQLFSVNGNAPILPEHLLAKYNDAKGSLNTAPFNSAPIGSGPFRVVGWQRGSEIRMEAYPNYFLGKPKLNEVIYKVMPDENTLETQLQTHEVDMVVRGTAINSQRYQQLAADPNAGLTLDAPPTYTYTHIDFNLKRPMFDRNVRVALDYATNRSGIIEKIAHGFATPAETDQSPLLSWAYTNDITHHPFDPAKARALLDADGWKVGSDGIRVKNGERLSFNLSTPSESTYGKAIQTYVQQLWHDVGAEAVIKNAPSDTFFDNSPATGILQGGHYDVALFSWVAAADPDDSPLYTTKNFAPGGQNSLFWSNPKVDAAAQDALETLDQTRRKADYKIVQQQMAEDVPTIVLYFWKTIYEYNDDLKGFTPSPVLSAFWNPQEYSI